MRVLVTWGSKRGGTEGLARMVAEALEREGVDAVLASTRTVSDASAFDAVIVGGALYANRWHRAASSFVKRHSDELRALPVWFFSSGPLDDSAQRNQIPPTKQVRALMNRVGARGHATFGGRLAPEARGFIASKMAQTRSGDWRDMEQVRAWAADVTTSLKAAPQRQAPSLNSGHKASPWLLAGLCFFAGLTAIGGGLELVWRPDGSLIRAPLSLLEHTPFRDFFIPGLVLMAIVGGSNLLAGVRLVRQHARASTAAMRSGAILAAWIVLQVILIRQVHWLHSVYLMLGFAILGLASHRHHFETPQQPAPHAASPRP